MRRIILAVLLIWFIGQAMSADPPLQEKTKEILFNYEDSTSGNGNFASNNKIIAHGPHSDARIYRRLADVYLQESDHGSGSIERGMIIKSTESNKEQICPDMIYAYALIAVLKNNSVVYNPQIMAVGNGYYAIHPVNFKSLLSDTTQIKNYASETSMCQETRYAKAINTDLMGSAEDDYSGWNPSNSLARTLMNLNEGVASGTAHIGMLQGNIGSRDFGKSAWHKANVNIDEDYSGTFNLATKMNLTIPVSKTKIEEDDSWLPCCSGGYSDMPIGYQEGFKGFGSNVKSIFDCTCPKGPAKAQYLKGDET